MKEKARIASAWPGVVLALMLAGCATPPSIDASALPRVPEAFKESRSEGELRFKLVTTTPADGRWWTVFGDPVLDDLVHRADERNTSIQVAAARLLQARALFQQSNAERMPQAGVAAGVQRADGLTFTNLPPGHPRAFHSAAANASWEADLFGKLRRSSEAASFDAQAREALLRNARLLIEADVAQSYLALRALDEERRIVRQTVDAYRGTLDLTERRYRAGDVAELDVARATTQVAATQADALALDRRRAQLEHAVAVLVGEMPSAFSIEEAPLDAALPGIPAGLPADVLARRPDVAAAQATMLAAQARVGVAKAAWFPDIALTGAGGVASTAASELFKYSARAWSVGLLASLPVFDGGRREAGVKFAGGDMDAAVAQYREQVLVAVRDVEDQLSSLRLLERQAEAQGRAVEAASRATALSDRRWREGLVSQLDLLDAQRSELADRRAAVEVKGAQYQATVGLVRALGGGWELKS